MKNFTILIISLFSFSCTFAQIEWEWSSPKALSDSTTDNLNACLLSFKPNSDVVWQKVINESTTALCMKRINDSTDSEHIILQTEGVKYACPTGYETDYYAGNYKLILFQADDGTDNPRIQSIILSDDSISDPVTVSDATDHESKPLIVDKSIYWLNDSCLIASYFDEITKTFSSPVQLITGSLYSLNASAGGGITYLVSDGQNTAVVMKYVSYYNNNWYVSSGDSIVIESQINNLNLTSGAWFGGSSWAAEVHSGPRSGDIIYTSLWSGTDYLHSDFNIQEPTIDGYMIAVDGFNAMAFFAYVSDSLGQNEIFAINPFEQDFRNISQNPGEDNNPHFFQTMLDFNTIRDYLIWESERQGHKTLYYTSIDYEIGANKKPDNIISISISPNPFTSQTTITFPVMQNPVVKIYSMQGKEIRNLTDFSFRNSNRQTVWDGKDNKGSNVPTGNYLVVVQGDKGVNSAVIVKQ